MQTSTLRFKITQAKTRSFKRPGGKIIYASLVRDKRVQFFTNQWTLLIYARDTFCVKH